MLWSSHSMQPCCLCSPPLHPPTPHLRLLARHRTQDERGAGAAARLAAGAAADHSGRSADGPRQRAVCGPRLRDEPLQYRRRLHAVWRKQQALQHGAARAAVGAPLLPPRPRHGEQLVGGRILGVAVCAGRVGVGVCGVTGGSAPGPAARQHPGSSAPAARPCPATCPPPHPR